SATRNLVLQAPSTTPNGLAPGWLQVAPGVATDPSLWQNADLPTQSTSNGQTTVTIQQTAQKAILTWSQFNVGKDTTSISTRRQATVRPATTGSRPTASSIPRACRARSWARSRPKAPST